MPLFRENHLPNANAPVLVQHNAHVHTWLDFWCSQLDRKVRSYERKDERKWKGDDQLDREEGDLYA